MGEVYFDRPAKTTLAQLKDIYPLWRQKITLSAQDALQGLAGVAAGFDRPISLLWKEQRLVLALYQISHVYA